MTVELESRRFVVGIRTSELTEAERNLYRRLPPLGFLLFEANLETAAQSVALIEELKALADPAPLIFVDQEGGPVDRIGPLLAERFPAPSYLSEKGSDRVHECAYLMGRAARMLGFDVDLAPVVDLAQPGTGAVVLKDRSFGFHAEDVVLAGMMFVHGLARAGMASCLKHFPGIGRGPVDSHHALPVVDAHDVDLMVTDVAPFTKLARISDGVMVGHAAYPLMTDGEMTSASMTASIYRILRGPVAFDGVAYTDDLIMGALDGSLAERAVRASQAGADVLMVSEPGEGFEEIVAAVKREASASEQVWSRTGRLREKCQEWRRERWSPDGWVRLAEEVRAFKALLEKKREPSGD